MGKYRFRLSDMIPNAWFYKLKDMNRPRNHHRIIINKQQSSSSLSSTSLSSVQQQNHPSEKHTNKPHLSEQRKSYYFTRDLNLRQDSVPVPTEPPRKSSRRRRSHKKNRPPENQTGPRLVSSSISAGCSCKATLESVWAKPDPDSKAEDEPTGSSSEPDSILTEYGSDRGLNPDTFDGALSWSSSCKCRTENDIVIDMVDDDDNKPFNDLPKIITKKNDDDDDETTKIQRTSAEFSYGSLSVKVVKEDFLSGAAAKTGASPAMRRIFGNSSSSPGVKLRTNSPRIANRRIHGGRKSTSSSGGRARRSVSDSFAVVKSSKDPRRDFRESMVEMILENNIRASNDLEELLACYLSLNSDEYHDIIINVFKQIWFDFIHLRLK